MALKYDNNIGPMIVDDTSGKVLGYQDERGVNRYLDGTLMPPTESGLGTPVSTGLSPSGDTTGATDYAGIVAQLEASGVARLGPGTFYVNAAIPLNVTGYGIIGAGEGSTFIRSATGNTDVVIMGSQGVPNTNTYTFKNFLRHLTITGTQSGTGNGVRLSYCGEYELIGVNVEKQGASGVINVNSYDGYFSGFASTDNVLYGINAAGTAFNEITFLGAVIVRNKSSGMVLSSTTWRTVRFYGGNVEFNSQSGLQWGTISPADAFQIRTSGYGFECFMYFEANADNSTTTWGIHVTNNATVEAGVVRLYNNPTAIPANFRIDSGSAFKGTIDGCVIDDQGTTPLWATTQPSSSSAQSNLGAVQFPLQYQKLVPGYSYGNTFFPGNGAPVHIFDAYGLAVPASFRMAGVESLGFDGKTVQNVQVGASGTVTAKGAGTLLPMLVTNYSAGQATAKIYNEFKGGIVIGDGDDVLKIVKADGTTTAAAISNKGGVRPGTPAGVSQTATNIYAGSGAPNNADGANGDVYIRADGGASTTIYHKRAGSWVGIL